MEPHPRLRTAVAAAFLLLGASVAAQAAVPEIPFEKYTLANGLEMILHVDNSAPTAHVEVWYKVGSKDEVAGRTGFAHLFEHIMFQGTKHIPEDAFFKYLAEAGASNRNGTTNFDRTNYYETVPSNQIELALWLESSRMGFLLERPSFRATFENQRDVVKNERRQRIENAPMGDVWRIQLLTLFPAGHPYHHEVIGSMADLDAAQENQIKDFFYRYYAPNNATLMIAGDIDVSKTKSLVEKYFGGIPTGPTLPRRTAPPLPAPMGERRLPMEAKVNLPTQYMLWPTVPIFAPGDAELDVLARVLAGGKTSRLYKRLVHEMKIAQNVSAEHYSLLHAGILEITFTPLGGHTLAEIEKVVDEELDNIRAMPVEPRELERVNNEIRTGFFRSLEPLAGRAGRLQSYNYYTGDPGFMAKDLARYQAVDATAVQRYADKYVHKDARVVITVEPNPQAPIMGRLKK